ncbi:autoinducer binding domain-containing protein [Roseiarcaceae bacterium H3SJ34-1]|uniref:helix-turn-helix transcriptional regulator n=1 Tax=Terripilifer ovatus TaxID=3032367 RepID=UPI003AB9A920|nr:autoinducer binding domain-containing protein [Roseiarcaceae bacterium H3SJ34-1]
MRERAGLDFLDFCTNEPDVAKVIDRFLETIKVFGFDVSAGGAWAGTGAARKHRFYFNNWPKDWLDFYLAQDFFLNDPMVLESQRRMTPFLWGEMAEARSFTVEGAAATEAARAYGWREVMGVPIHGPASYQGLVSIASLQPVSLSAADRALLRVMAVSVHDRAHASVGLGEPAPLEVELTPREADCMRWVAAGKTDAEIGLILGIATATAHFHVERVKKKYGTRSRSEAVAFLVLAGII